MKIDCVLCRKFARSLLTLSMLILGQVMTVPTTHGASFSATGPTTPPAQGYYNTPYYPGAVTVSFDLLPTTMSFDLPQYYCMVTENGIKFAPLGAQTYDPRNGDTTLWGPGRDATCHYAAAWIDRQNAARIVVRARYALCNDNGNIAHSDFASGSPYGAGDWADEWWYIYPDGTCTRDVKLYTGLARLSKPYGTFSGVDNVIHQFMTASIIGPQGHVPTDDINTSALQLFKMWGAAMGEPLALGTNTTISYSPYPADFGTWRDSNIEWINTKSTYKPFVMGLPYGMRAEPYTLGSDSSSSVFETWTNYHSVPGYVSALGRMAYYWYYQKHATTVEQVYLQGMTTNTSPKSELMHLAWSWIVPAMLWQTNGVNITHNYLQFTYDPAQKAYVLPRANITPAQFSFNLISLYDDDDLTNTFWVVHPAIVVSNWSAGAALSVGGSKLTALTEGTDYRVGHEANSLGGSNLVLWVNKTYFNYTNPTYILNFTVTPK